MLVSNTHCADAASAEPKGSESPVELTTLADLGLETLLNMEVTSVAKKAQRLSESAAAIHVITNEDLRRSGVTVIAEALRMVPGLSVARANSRRWAIGSRGFNDVYSNKLLVLMDGRTLYTPLFSGVYWEQVDTVLEDVDRIEVIRGPGATLWGANAVNGVINITTKSAKDTQGVLISGGGGSEERGFGTVRYGGKLGSNVYYRVYGKYSNRDNSTLFDTGGSASDSWWTTQSGFRMDWDPSKIHHATLQGGFYYGELGDRLWFRIPDRPSLVPRDVRSTVEGQNVLGRWTHEFSEDSNASIQMYYDRIDRTSGINNELRDTFDLDAQHRFALGERNDIVWGAGYRYSADEITQSADFTMLDPSVGLQLASAFVQDEITLVPDRLRVTLGTKLEHNDFTGFEVQPSARVAWTPRERHTIWGAVSRAVRTPSRVERGVSIFVDPEDQLPLGTIPIVATVAGNPKFGAEEVIAYELGYRAQATPRLTLDLAAFYNDYDDLRSQNLTGIDLQLSPSPHLIASTTLDNDLFGKTYGAEVSATWQFHNAWRLRAGYTYLKAQLHARGTDPVFIKVDQEASPDHQVFLWSDADLGSDVEWGLGLRHVSTLNIQEIPAYTELETRLAWEPNPNCELAIVGRNLLNPHHREFEPSILVVRNFEIDRAVYGKVTLRF